MSAFKPMLAATLPVGETPALPCLVSPKLDGVRAVVIDGVVYSRNLKPIPNARVQRRFGRPKFNGLDGELIVGEPTALDAYRNTMSGVMRREGEPDVTFHAFDDFNYSSLFWDRLQRVIDRVNDYAERDLVVVPHRRIANALGFQQAEEGYLEEGYEGMMARSLTGPYKHGRATAKEGYLLKVKRFLDGEARVEGVQAWQRNDNAQELDELGRAKRSSAKAGKVELPMLGALVVRDLKTHALFAIGTGFRLAERLELWQGGPDQLLGKIARYRFFPTGSKDAPRFPVFNGWRDPIDL